MQLKVEKNVGDIDYPLFHARLSDTVFIIQDIFKDKKSYKELVTELYTYMLQGFERKEVRTHLVQFKFTNEPNEKIHTMQVRHFIVNLFLWFAFIRYGKIDELNSGQIFDCEETVTAKRLYNWINTHLIDPYQTTFDNNTISKALDDCIYLLSLIYIDFTLIMGLTIDMESFIEMAERYPKFNDLMHTKPLPGMQPSDIEDMMATKLNEYLDIVLNQDKTNNIRPFLITGMGINKQQLSQLSIMGGLKPDIEGNVNPIPIDSNFIQGGLDSISNFYVDAQAGCKPLILNKTVMGNSGYFAYKTMTLSSNYRLSQTTNDCHSKRLIIFDVKTDDHLKKLNKRYYRLMKDSEDELRCINYKKDKHLIGKTILLRDPTTCACKDGICHICYGDLYYTNNDPYFHAGRFAATQINNPLQQKILSVKHTLTTVSDKIDFGPDFDRFFKLDRSKIKLNMDTNEKLADWKFFIDDQYLFMLDDLSRDEDFNYFIERFSLINKKTGERIDFQEGDERGIYLFSSTASILRKDKQLEGKSFSLSSLNEDLPVGIINIVNNEVTTPLKNIIKLLDRKGNYGCNTIDDMVNKMVQLTIDSGMTVDAVHSSMILKGLIRDADNILMPPKFDGGEDHYQILALSKALLYNPSFTVSFSFDNVNKQINSPYTYRKYKPSDYDIFYREEIYDQSKKYYKTKKERKHEKKMKKARERMWQELYGNREEAV